MTKTQNKQFSLINNDKQSIYAIMAAIWKFKNHRTYTVKHNTQYIKPAA